jgi:hypothetical protein
VRDLPIKRERRSNPHVGAAAMKRRHQVARDVAYEHGHAEWDVLCARSSFRDFVAMYIGEGSKRSRNTVALSNSDSDVILLAEHWMRQLSRNRLTYEVHHHADQAPDDLRRFWSRLLRISPEEVRLCRKTNSGQLRHRNWRCRHGVMLVKTHDTLLRARLQAWMDCIREEWLNSAP